MAHWSDKYVGIPYELGKFDCADMVELVQRDVFYRTINIPKDRNYSNKTGAVARYRAITNQIKKFKDSIAVPTKLPFDGDGVLMLTGSHPGHIGIYCVIQGCPYVLHCDEAARQVVRTQLSNLNRLSLKLEGYYKWI